MPTPLLVFSDLLIGYGPLRIAGPLSATLQPGELACLLGPNGAGKTTLLRTLAGMQPALGGAVEVAGQQVAGLTARHRARQLAMVLTEQPDVPFLTVGQLVEQGRFPHTNWIGELAPPDRQQVQEALRMVGLTEKAGVPLRHLSDGQRQKALIARALAQDTPLLLLDEPTAHLDLPNRVEIFRLLRQLAAHSQKAILLSTHELDLALQHADRVWLLSERQLLTGTPEELALGGHIGAAFDRPGIRFNPANSLFEPHEQFVRTVRLSGPEPLLFWTRRALLRKGIGTVGPEEASEALPELSIHPGPDGPCWHLRTSPENFRTFRNLSELVDFTVKSEE